MTRRERAMVLIQLLLPAALPNADREAAMNPLALTRRE
jgi:hypothetical protein